MGSEPIRLLQTSTAHGARCYIERTGHANEARDLPEYLALPASDFLALQRRAEEAERAAAEAKAMHARILAWPPEDVLRAEAVIAQAAALIARKGDGSGKHVLDALDALKRHRAQQDAEIDRLRAEGGRDA